VVAYDSMVTQIQSLEIKVIDNDRNVLKEKWRTLPRVVCKGREIPCIRKCWHDSRNGLYDARPDGDWWYYTRSAEGKLHGALPGARLPRTEYCMAKQSPLSCPTKKSLDERVGERSEYCGTGAVKHLPSHKLLLFDRFERRRNVKCTCKI
jgi:hypothetical protein